jgi:glutaminyl-peptide cyclotransferase
VGRPKAPPFSIENIQLFMLFDLLGKFYSHPPLGSVDTKLSPHFRTTFPYYQQLYSVQSRLYSQSLISSTQYFRLFTTTPSGSGFVVDDHTPFQRLGLINIFHLITLPFPSVWHRKLDNVDSLDLNVCRDLALIFRTFVQEFKVMPSPDN